MLSAVSLLTAIVVGVFVFAAGYFWRGFKGARGNLRDLRGSMPAARKGYWRSLWSLIKWGLGAVLVAAALLTWTARDLTDAADTKPSPSHTQSSHPKAARG
jgi:hypothetical protein